MSSTPTYFTNTKIRTHQHSDQVYWNAFSQQTVEIASNILNNPLYQKNFKFLLLFLGEKRHVAAQILGHEKHNHRTHKYGQPRFGMRCLELVTNPGVWQELYPAIQTRLEKDRNSPYFSKDSSNGSYVYSNNDFIITINKDEYMFSYPLVADRKAFSKNCQALQPDFDALLTWNGDDLDEFVKGLGRLSYSLYRQLPFFLGTSAIVHWLTRAVARYKGVELGPLQDNENDLPLDWEAFLTYEREKYANWFLKHAFQWHKLNRINPERNHSNQALSVASLLTQVNSHQSSHPIYSKSREYDSPVQENSLTQTLQH